MFEKLKKCKTFKEASELIFGVDYYNGRIKEKLKDFCIENYGLNPEDIIKREKNYCLFCGKEINKSKKFCNSSCSASFNNKKRIVSDDQKEKTSKKLKSYHKLKREREGIQKIKKIKDRGKIITLRLYEHHCPVCGTMFYGKRGQKYCSIKCSNQSEEKIEHNKELIKQKIKNGTFVGWKTRPKNMQSYPEKYWEQVLTENKIVNEREVKIGKYFLDFLIEINGKKIDLEIDGKQHKEECVLEKDKKRDLYLTENGFLIYRVEWNEVRSKKGKELVQEKIKKFVEYVNKIK